MATTIVEERIARIYFSNFAILNFRRKKLAHQLEACTDEYSYLKLDAQRDYYALNSSPDEEMALVDVEGEASGEAAKKLADANENADEKSAASPPLSLRQPLQTTLSGDSTSSSTSGLIRSTPVEIAAEKSS